MGTDVVPEGWVRKQVVVTFPSHWGWGEINQAIIAKVNRDKERDEHLQRGADDGPFGFGSE